MNITKNLLELSQYIDGLGWIHGLRAFFKVKFNKTNSIHLRNINYPIKLRKGSSDINAFRQVFVFKEYDFELTTNPKFIIDGGSNVGLAAIYFANRFPNATIASVEPESGNFELLQANTRHYKNIHPIKSGIWNSTTFLKVKNIGLGNWGFIVEEHEKEDNETFRAISITDIMKQFNMSEIDILKLDVEGAEKEIFSKDYHEWLSKTNTLVIELHDRMKKGCSKAFFNAINSYDFSIHQMGENLICTKQD